MFHQTRLQLTAWYLLVITSISVLFSTAFYNSATVEVQRIIDRMENEIQDPFDQYQIPSQIIQQRINDLASSKQRLLYSLIFLNGIIFIVAGGGGYFLAGRTLRPIQEMMVEQNRFIADASHELRTPLTATRTSIEVALRDKNLSLSDAKRVLEGSLEDITAIQALSDDLLRLSHVENSQADKKVFKKVSLAEIADRAVKKVSALAKAKDITVTQKTTKHFIRGDSLGLEELLIIFLDNAIKYSPEKSMVTMTTKKSDGHVLFIIADTGMGIEKKELGHIFDRFYRVEKSRTKNTVRGYGLGLSIAKKIIEEHNGTVKVESVIGKGTIFTISFPVIG